MFLLIAVPLISEEGRLGREANDYKYTSLGIDIIQSEGTDIGAKLSFKLPGPLYVVIERKAENVDTENKTYGRVINGARIGAHSGIGDLLSNVSAKGVNLGIKNVFDLYGEIGIKSVKSISEEFLRSKKLSSLPASLPWLNSISKLFCRASESCWAALNEQAAVALLKHRQCGCVHEEFAEVDAD